MSEQAWDPGFSSRVYLTADQPPVGGRLREAPEDFFVEELPLYEPSGEGEHIYLLVEKRNLSTMELVDAVASHFGVRRNAVGFAGLKDKVAVTRQHLSVHVPGKRLEDFPYFEHERVGILWTDRHSNKLRRGHLAGNRFVIRIRGVEATKAVTAQRVLTALERTGVPNRIGEQRFGFLGNNHLVGRAMILGEARAALDLMLGPCEAKPDLQSEARQLYLGRRYDEARHAFPRRFDAERRALASLAKGEGPGRALARMDEMQRSYFITAFQSAVFNGVLDARLRDGTLGALVPGDLAYKHDNGAVFAVDERELEGEAGETLRARLARLEVSPSGPMWGARMTRAGGAVGEAEVGALEAAGVSVERLAAFAESSKIVDAVEGARRPLRVPLSFPDVEGGMDERGHYVKCTFELPRGAFATTVMREIMKPADGAEPGVETAEGGESAEEEA